MITFRQIPYNAEDENSISFIGMGTTEAYEIVLDGTYTIGSVFIDTEYGEYLLEGDEAPANYITWIEIMTCYRGKHLFRHVMDALKEKYGKLYLEATESSEAKYKSIGAKFVMCDEMTELNVYVF